MAINLENEIQMVGIIKEYGSFRALSNVDLTIRPGEFLTFLGPSGSGKSTLLMTLAGFVAPTDGNIFFGGKSIIAVPPERRNFGVVFQGYALFPHMTVAENLAYPLTIRKLPRAEIAEKVRQTLELVQLAHLAGRLPKQLSGGQQQRVALARALVFSPGVLLLDEPMGALDKNLRHDLQIELRILHRKLGRTFVNVTHDQEEAMTMSDRIAIMSEGRIVQIGDPRSLYEAPRTRFVASFLGKSNIFEGKFVAREGTTAIIEVAGGPPTRHELREAEPVSTVGADILLALRPQKLRIGAGANRMRVRVDSAVFLGTHAEIGLRSATGQHLTAHISLEQALRLPEEGTEIEVGWDPEDTAIVLPD